MASLFDRKFGTIVFAIWIVVCCLLLFMARAAISHWAFGDPDDQLRVVQVRDWMAGQSWWDITQHRMNPPAGGPMHWSRLVDVPIAGAILFFGLFLQGEQAELAAFGTVPLMTFGAGLFFYARLGRRLFGAPAALLASALVVTLIPVMGQLVPMRIDHHGWQIVLFLAASVALFSDRMPRLAGAVVGLCCALWLEISIEGLPFAVLLLGMLALRWLCPKLSNHADPQGGLLAGIAALAMGSAILFAITENMGVHGNHCDSLSPVHIAAFAAVAFVLIAGTALARAFNLIVNLPEKIGLCVAAGIAGISVLLLIAPQCTGDAFASLDPLVRDYWFSRTQEGLPLWAIDPGIALPSWSAYAAGLLALGLLWAQRIPEKLGERVVLTLLFLGCAAVGMLVSRTTLYAVLLANLFAAAVFVDWMRRADLSTAMLRRMGLRIAAVMLIFPSAFATIAMGLAHRSETTTTAEVASKSDDFDTKVRLCQSAKAYRALASLPKGSQLMAGLDSSPGILVFTGNKVVATGHHRNHKAMADVIRTFIGSEAEARAIYQARKIEYLVMCDGSYELRDYRDRAPAGFAAQISRGNLPDWLVKDRVAGPFTVYRVTGLAEKAR